MNKKEFEQRYLDLQERITNCTDKSQLKYIVYEMERLERQQALESGNKLLKTFFILITLLIFVGILVISYFNPSSEILTCDKNYVCTVEHEFLFGIKTKNKFEITQNSNLFSIEKRTHRHYIDYYLVISDKYDNEVSPFIDNIYGIQSTTFMTDAQAQYVKNQFNNLRKQFLEYRLTPEKGFSVINNTNPNNFDWAFFFSFLCIILWFLKTRKNINL